MKLKYKLACEYATKNEPTDMCIGQFNPTIPAFLAGFEKAREMAIDAVYKSGCDPTGYSESRVSEIGEEEV